MPGGRGTANAVVICTVPITQHDEMGVIGSISVLVDWIELDDVYYMYVGCQDSDDTSGAVKIEYKVTSMDPLTVTTTIPGGGDDGIAVQQADPYGEDGHMRLQFCADHMTGQIQAGVVSAAHQPAWAEVDMGTGRYVAVGHSNTGHQNRFDDFNMEEMRLPYEICAKCWCWCLRNVPFRHMTATITNATGRADCLSGVTWSMDWERDGAIDQWVGTAEMESAAYVGAVQEVDWTLKCDAYDDDNPDHPGHNWILKAGNSGCQFSTDGGYDSNGSHRANDDSECEPEMVLRFGPFTMAKSDLTCYLCYAPAGGSEDPDDGEFYVEITE